MKLKTFAEALRPIQRKYIAEHAGTTVSYLSQVLNGHRRASPNLARRIELAVKSTIKNEAEHISRADIRPDIWGN